MSICHACRHAVPVQAAPAFIVALQDYYGNQGLAEFAGNCQVVHNGTAITLPELGRVVNINNGTSTFQQLTIQGNNSFDE